MRLNKWIAAHTLHSRRKADELIAAGRVTVNGATAQLGTTAEDDDAVTIDNKPVKPGFSTQKTVLVLNKPVGYVCSRNGQGAPTVYSLIPLQYHHLDIVGRLDKDSSGLLVLTNDGDLHHQLTHPSSKKEKVYIVTLSTPLDKDSEHDITHEGVPLEDGTSILKLHALSSDRTKWEVRMHEGRNRQIRRTFYTLGYGVNTLHRTHFGPYKLLGLADGKFAKEQ